MKQEYKPLFIIKDFNNLEDPYGIQARNFISGLVEYGIIPTIYAKRSKCHLSEEHNLNVMSVRELPFKYFAAIVRRVFPEIIEIPDLERYTFKPLLVKKIISDSKKEFNYNWIHSISNPTSNHLAALYLKNKFNVPWVAHFYDPFIGNIYRYKKKRIRKFNKYNQALEKKIVIHADLIIHTNQIIANDWIDRYGKLVENKLLVLPFNYGYNIKPLIIKEQIFHQNKKRVLLYVGKLYQNRNLNDLVDALCYLSNKIPELQKKLVVKIVGVISKQNIIKIKKNNLTNLFDLVGIKSQSELMPFYNEADALLVIDAPTEKSLFFPSKLMEYFLQLKPIIAITPLNGITYKLLESSGHSPYKNGAIQEIAEYIEELIVNPNSKQNFNIEFYKKFIPEKISTTYMNHMQYILEKY